MKTFKSCLSLLAVATIGTLVACSTKSTKAADVSGSIRTSLDQAGLKAVSIGDDPDKGVVTLGGHVAADAEKSTSPVHRNIAGWARKLYRIRLK